MQGLIIYYKKDYIKNKKYVNWLKNVAKKKSIELELIFADDVIKRGVKKENIDFVINRSRNYNISIFFELNNIKVFNNSKVTLLGNNKLSGYNLAKSLGINFPEIYLKWKDKKYIEKPIYQHGGRGIKIITNKNNESFNNKVKQKSLILKQIT